MNENHNNRIELPLFIREWRTPHTYVYSTLYSLCAMLSEQRAKFEQSIDWIYSRPDSIDWLISKIEIMPVVTLTGTYRAIPTHSSSTYLSKLSKNPEMHVRVLGDGAGWPNWLEKRFEVNSVIRPLVIARDDCYGPMTTLNSSELKRVQCTCMHIYRDTIMELWTNVLMLNADVYAMHVVVMWISHVTFVCWFSLSLLHIGYGAQPILAHKNRNRKLWKWNGVVNVL